MERRVFHFVLGGVLLFAIDAFMSSTGSGKPTRPVASRPLIVISGAQIAQLREDYARQTGMAASAAEELRLIDEAIEEEVLYREAFARGLHLGDRSVRYRLIQKMRFLAGDEEADDEQLYRQAVELDLAREDLVIRRILTNKVRYVMKLSSGVGEPTDEELQAYLERNRAPYVQPAQLSLTHVFLSAERRGESLDSDTRRLLTRIRADSLRPEVASDLGDRFPLGHRFKLRSKQSLEKIFGSGFAEAVFELEPGGWSDPVRSGYGLHLVWVRELRPARLPALEAVRTRVRGALIHERRERRYEEMLADLRKQYNVRVERADTATPQRRS